MKKFYLISQQSKKLLTMLTVVCSFLLFSQTIYAQTEICDNGIDDDGDGLIDCEDADCNPFVNYFANPSMESYSPCPNYSNVGTIDYADSWTTTMAPPAYGGQLMVNDPGVCVSPRPSSSWPETANMPSGSDGVAWLGMHVGEDVQNTLTQVLKPGDYSFSFDAGYAVNNPWNQPGSFDFYGVAVGDPDFSTNYFLGNSGKVTNQLQSTDPNWQTYSLTFTSTVDIDRIFMVARDSLGGTTANSYMYFDNFVITAEVPELAITANCDIEVTNHPMVGIASYNVYINGALAFNTDTSLITPTQMGVVTIVGLTEMGCETQTSEPIETCNCDDVMNGTVDVCAVLTANPGNPLATEDCDGDGEDNATECSNNTDPDEPCSNSYANGAAVCAAIENGATGFTGVDCDGGGIDDDVECTNGNDPDDPSDDCDLVNDGTVDLCAILTADPTNPMATLDCDGDGEDNATECGNGTDPGDPCRNSVMPDTDGDGVVDECDLDDDNDGIPDLIETGGIDPQTDADGDGVPIFLDDDDNDDTVGDNNNAIEAGYDTDTDGIPDFFDLDSDGDGCSDALEAGATDDTSTDFQFLSTDASDDGIPDSVQITSGVNSGTVDYTIIETNTGTYDFLDPTVSVACYADVELTKTVSDTFPTVLESVTFTVEVINKGFELTDSLTVLDTVPSGFTYQSHIASVGTYDENTGIWFIDTLLASDTVSLDITVRAEADGNHTNIAQVIKSTEDDPDSEPNNDDGDQSEDDEGVVEVIVNVPAEICDNGIDDDGDGKVDAFDNDCDCGLDNYGNYIALCSPDCQFVYQDTTEFALEEQWANTTNQTISYASPLVGDLDGDSIQEVIILANTGYAGNPRVAKDIHILDGRTGALIRTIETPYIDWSVAMPYLIADVDNDGAGEIIVASSSLDNNNNAQQPSLYCYNYDGTQKWQSDATYTANSLNHRSSGAPGIADFNHDGIPEVYILNEIFNAQTGKKLADGGAFGVGGGLLSNIVGYVSITVAGDFIPSTNNLELAAGNTVYKVEINNTDGIAGNTMTPIVMGGFNDGYTSAADINLDGRLDVIVSPLLDSSIYVWDPVGDSLIAKSSTMETLKSGLAFIGDVDNDGKPNIGVCGEEILYMLYYDGTTTLKENWTLATSDNSGATGLTMFDFDQNGSAEIVYRDQTELRILDGATGSNLATIASTSGTAFEMPIVADIDNDSQAEILVTTNNGVTTAVGYLKAYRSAADPWSPARPVWNQHAYHNTHINDDLSVPKDEQNHGIYYVSEAVSCASGRTGWILNNYLQQAAPRDRNGCLVYPSSNAEIEQLGVACTQDDSLSVEVTYRVTNSGDTYIEEGVPVSFYDANPLTGTANLLTTVNLDTIIAQLDSVVFTSIIPINNYTGSGYIYIVVNDDGLEETPISLPTTAYPECDYTNNLDSIWTDGCVTDLEIEKTANKTDFYVSDYDTVFYSIKVYNRGVFPTSGIIVYDSIPEALTYLASELIVPDGTTYDPLTGIWDLSSLTLAYGDSVTAVLAGKIGIECESISNTAVILQQDKADTDTILTSNPLLNDTISTVVINVLDTILPTIVAPEDLTLDGCDTSAVTVDITGLIYSTTEMEVDSATFIALDETSDVYDNIRIALITYQDSSDGNSCPETIRRTFVATDNCGNESSVTQTIILQDIEIPVFDNTAPYDTLVNCDAVPVMDVITATDNCTDPINVTTSEVRADGSCANNYTLTRKWFAEDACGNIDSLVQIITVQDTIAPVFSSTPSDSLVNCDAVPDMDEITATDNCTSAITVRTSEVRVDGSCANNYTLTRKWFAEDECGNIDSLVQIITVQDTTPPNFTIPADITVAKDANCEIDTTTGSAGYLLSLNDNCTDSLNIVVNYIDDDSGLNQCSGTGEILRKWIVEDECGNVSDTVIQRITIEDQTAPVIECPDNVVYSVDDNFSEQLVSIPLPTVSDNCSAVTFTNDFNGEADASGVYPEGLTTVTYTATDECGNVDSCDFTVQVICDGQTRIDGVIFNVDDSVALPNVMVLLQPTGSTEGQARLCVTNSNGEYVFTGMDPGDYLVLVQDAGINKSGPFYPVESSLFLTTIVDCEFQTHDFNYERNVPPVILGDFVWYDANANGLQDEWYDANDDGEITENIPDARGGVNYNDWEWIDLNGDGSYSGEENEGELNKAGIGNRTSTGITVEGPNGYSNTTGISKLGYYRDVPNEYGDYTVTFDFSDELREEAVKMYESGLVKIVPNFVKSARMSKSASLTNGDNADCGVTTDNPQQTTLTEENPEDLTLDFGVRCVTFPTHVGVVEACPITEFNDTAMFTLEVADIQVDTSGVDSVSYYDSYSNAEDGIDALISPYISPDKTIWARIQDTATGSYNIDVVQLHVLETPVIDIEGTEIICTEGEGEIGVNVLSGEPVYTYQWSNGETTDTITGLNSGTYSVIVTDVNGCTREDSFVIELADPLDITTVPAVISKPDCYGTSTGDIDLTVSGGTAPYQYIWSNGYNSEDLTDVPAGTYNVTVTDANGCFITSSDYVLEDTTEITITVDDIIGTSCGGASGSVVLTSSDGSDITVGGTTQASGTTFNGLGAGLYTATSNGDCVVTEEFVIPNTNSSFTATIEVSDIVCNGNNNGTATVTASGGVGTLTYSLNGAAAVNTNIFTGLGEGAYNVHITDAAGCSYNVSFDIDEPDSLSMVLANKQDADCNASGELILVGQGGVAPYTFTASSGTVVGNSITALSSGDVTVTITDANGCTAESVFTVNDQDLTPPTFTCPVTETLYSNDECKVSVPDLTALVTDATDNCSPDDAITVSQTIAAGEIMSTDITVTLVVSDTSGNSSYCDVLLVVLDTTSPVAICQNITRQLDMTGMVHISPDDIDNGSYDNCGLMNWSLDSTTFDCSELGANTVVLTVTDDAGNTSTCEATVTIEDNIIPILDCPSPVELVADENCQSEIPDFVSALSNNNCGNATVTQNPLAGEIALLGVNTVEIVATDGSGNADTCWVDVTVVDETAPTFTCPETQQVYSDVNCQSTVPDLTVLVTDEADNCSESVSVIQSIDAGTTISGDIPVTITVSDANGNSAECEVLLTVADSTPPVAICQNITHQLDMTGMVNIGPDDIDNGSYDNCGLMNWSLDRTSFGCSDIGENTVILTVTDDVGNTSTCEATVTIEDNVAPVLDCPSPVELVADENCEGVVPDFTSALSNNNCGNAMVTQNPTAGSLAVLGVNTVEIVATDGSGNADTCWVDVTVVDETAPTFTCPETQQVYSDVNCQSTVPDLTVLVTDEADNCSESVSVIQSIDAGTTISGDIPVTITVSDANGNSAECEVLLTVADSTPPVAICQNITHQLDMTGMVNIGPDDIDNGSYDNCGLMNWSLDRTSFGCSDIGENTVILTVTDDAGNTSTCEATVTIEDNVAPVLDCPSPVELVADENCEGVVPDFTSALSNNNCGNAMVTQNPTAGSLVVLGVNTVEIVATDGSGNTDTCWVDVTVVDETAPTFTCPETQQVYSDVNCQSTVPDLTALVTDEADNCSESVSVIQSIDAGTTISGDIPVTITVSDANGNSAECEVLLTVADSTPPVAICQNITHQLDMTGMVNIGPDDIDNGSYDNCGLMNWSLDRTSFGCSDIGENTVILTVTDDAGNTSTCEATVTIEDNVAPVLDCPSPVELVADENCEGVVPDFTSALSNNNCGNAMVTQNPTAGSLAVLGVNTVEIVATDGSGNTDTCWVDVTVVDETAPTFTCPETQQVYSDVNCQSTVPDLTALVTDEADNCSESVSVIQSIDAGTTISGDIPVTITVSDANGNSAECEVLLTVADSTPPVAICQNITHQLDMTGMVHISPDDIDNGSYDNCGLMNWSLDRTSFGCSDIGENTVILTVTDDAGNTSTCEATVTIEDNVAPVLDCPSPVELVADENCEGVVPDFTSALSNNNCGNAMVTQNPTAGSLAVLGVNTVEIVATDGSGNADTCWVDVTVVDETAPTFTCPETQQVYSDVNCQSTVPDLTVLVTDEADNCSESVSVIQSIDAGTTISGDIPVTITVSDANGNSAECEVLLTVADNTPPVAICQNITHQLDMTGMVHISPDDIDNGSYDNCGLMNWSLDRTSFGCSDIGENTVILTVTDDAGNTSTCEATVTIEDNVAPVLDCPSPVELVADENCEGVVPDFTSALSNNNCGNAMVTQNPTAGSLAVLGVNTVEIVATDGSGNADTCWVDVTVVDESAPEYECALPVSVSVDEGECFATVELIPPVAFDNCDFASIIMTYEIIASDNSTSGIIDTAGGLSYQFLTGNSRVKWAMADQSGNVSECVQEVEIIEDEVPVITCAENAEFDNTNDVCGYAVPDNSLDATATDNCELVSVTHNFGVWGDASSLAGATLPVGTTEIEWIAIDASGNADTCTTVVTVNDVQPPEFVNCPSGVTFTVGLSTDVCESGAIWSIPVARDNCSDVSVTQIGGPAQGSILSVGLYNITYMAEDEAGNTTTCSFNINVIDTDKPDIICQSNLVMESDSGKCSWTAPLQSLSPLLANSNCPATVSWTVTNPDGTEVSGADDVSGYEFALGTSIVAYKIVENASSQSSECSFTVTVEDKQAPVIECNLTIDIIASAGECSALVNLEPPVSTDNCSDNLEVYFRVFAADNSTSNLIKANNSSYEFQNGVSRIEWIVIDEAGNESRCWQNVWVSPDVDVLVPEAGINSSICETETFTTVATAPGYATVTWTTSGTGSFSDSSQILTTYIPSTNDIDDGFVILTLTSSIECASVSDQMLLRITRSPIISAGNDDAVCENADYQLSGAVIHNVSAIAWSSLGSGTFSNSDVYNPIYTPSQADIDAGKVALVLRGISGSTCSDVLDTMTLLINRLPIVDAGEDETIYAGSTTNLAVNVENGTGSYFYSWEPKLYVIDPNSNSTKTVELNAATTFEITVIDANTGCVGSDTKTITVEESAEGLLKFFTGFSPNGDGVNDTWVIEGIEKFPENKVMFFNRWGDKVKELINYNNTSVAWGGTNNKGDRLPDGTYYYVVDLQNIDEFTGWVHVRTDR